MGSTLVKTATALILLEWQRRSLAHRRHGRDRVDRGPLTYTGTVFAALGVFTALVVDELSRRDWRAVAPRAVIVAVVGALQVPYLIHQAAHRFRAPAMSAVTGSVGGIVRGTKPLRLAASGAADTYAVTYIP